ncbi:hypothetical protein V1517DRAFT_330898 [Lipomyces orientalis]|uniref:Uncharacterized protein n=1 Tax=Lipomyces orientalis TaxID=1233043 RepID=A0ACC3TFM7_9ASCO
MVEYKEGAFILDTDTSTYIRVLFPFGFGLSYTEFEVSAVQVSGTKLENGGSLDISAQVTNIGSSSGSEALQLYVGRKSITGSTTDRPIKELRAFAKVKLQSGERYKAVMTIDRQSPLWFVAPRHSSAWPCRETKH